MASTILWPKDQNESACCHVCWAFGKLPRYEALKLGPSLKTNSLMANPWSHTSVLLWRAISTNCKHLTMSSPPIHLTAQSAVNQAIRCKKVYLTEDGYIVDINLCESLSDYAVYGDALYKVPKGQELTGRSMHLINLLGQEWTHLLSYRSKHWKKSRLWYCRYTEEADVIVLESNNFDKSILGRKPPL